MSNATAVPATTIVEMTLVSGVTPNLTLLGERVPPGGVESAGRGHQVRVQRWIETNKGRMANGRKP